MSKKNILLTPGPTPVPEDILRAMAEPIFHHRTPRYRKIFSSVSERLKKVFLTKNPVYVLTGSGTSAMEASTVNFHSAGDETLVVENGKFSERFTQLAKAYSLKPTVIKVAYGEAVRPEQIAEALKKNPAIKSVCLELCETSTAVLQDIKAIGAVVAKTEAVLIVDAISGLGADRLETDAWGADIVVSASQKAIMLPPGLAFISVSEKARKKMEKSNLPKYYLDLKLYEKAAKDADTPFTPALTLVVGLEKVLDRIESEGIENIFKRCAELGTFTRRGLESMGLKLFSKAPSSTVSAASLPDGIDGEKLVQVMRDEKGVALAGGQGEMKGRVVRIAHMGAITKKDLEEGLRVLAETLHEMNRHSEAAGRRIS
ncbi:MAG: alanine--glyoxylate aminotransferase family protein [Candidatus Omnitrophica bacterium]|nr:alanine--glyoxylate aminotransferase family protein [Candidatus Omnitrophota bacterium]